jgi:hypothetical protein
MEFGNIVRNSWLRTAILAGGTLLCGGAQAQTLDFGSCVRIEDLSARLACYDRAAGRAPTSSAAAPVAPPASLPPPAPAPAPRAAVAPPAPAPVPAPTPAMPRDPVAAFGAEKAPDQLTAAKTKVEDTEVRQIEARVTAVRLRPAGEQVLTLDNGQVWAQTEKKDFPRFEVGDVVVIKRAMLGSFLLTLQKGSPSSRVHRIS